jgi:hypothetical protein
VPVNPARRFRAPTDPARLFCMRFRRLRVLARSVPGIVPVWHKVLPVAEKAQNINIKLHSRNVRKKTLDTASFSKIWVSL